MKELRTALIGALLFAAVAFAAGGEHQLSDLFRRFFTWSSTAITTTSAAPGIVSSQSSGNDAYGVTTAGSRYHFGIGPDDYFSSPNGVILMGSAQDPICTADGGQCAGASGAAVPVPPAPPTASGSTTYFYYQIDAGWPSVPTTIDSVMGLAIPVGQLGAYFPVVPGGATITWDSECFFPRAWGVTGLVGLKLQDTVPQPTGAPSSPAWATTSTITRSKEIDYQTAGSANAGGGLRSGQFSVWRGNAAGAGGFMFWTRAGTQTTAANSRFAVGLFNTVSVLTAAADPNAGTDTVYFGCNSGDTNLSICSNDNSGTATCTTLGASYPCTTSGAYYDFWLAAKPNDSVIAYFIQRLDTAAQVSGLISSDLPRNTVQLAWQTWINTGSGSAQLKVAWDGSCTMSNY